MNVALIPVRGGSKSIPLKNIKCIAGKPLIYWTLKAACESQCLDKVYIATDSPKIKEVVEGFGFEKACVIERSAETATDTASTEAVMIEFAQKYCFDNITLIQATSPLLRSEDIDRGTLLFKEKGTDSVLSVVRQKRFNWCIGENGYAAPQNYDFYNRPRRQDFEGYLVENGAFYITSREALLKSGCRISGNISVYEMDESTYFEIDEPSDWIIIEELLKKQINAKQKERVIPEIKLFLTDCDGCLTDGGMYYSESGDEMKKFNTLDGMGIGLLKKREILTGIITGETREINAQRAQKLGVDFLKQGVKDKLSVIRAICEERQIELENVAYVGDDINDLEAIQAVGYGCCVANGMECVKEAAAYVTRKRGGEGAIREVIDKILG